MDKKQLIARCGIWCGTCRQYLVRKKELFEEKGLKRGCEGCWIRDKNCTFIKKECAPLRNNEIEFCYECENFPCDNLTELDELYVSRYNMSLIENQKRIKQMGIKKWIKEQEELYTCPECSGEVCVHDAECYDCGNKYNPNIPP
ncbi:MAG: hypothetical protein BAJALOKI2v1_620020 [Promethearchaeota archaeon]|nr:MAG: hypothetical protein BAJALOKI2v1_620020 [Candidatus Lokiarchaeota archaeon]